MIRELRWHRTTAFVAFLCVGLAALWDYLFWGVPVGISAAIFAVVVGMVLVLRVPVLRKTMQGRIIAGLALLAIGALVEEPSTLAILMVLVTMGTLVLIGQNDVSLARDSVQAWAGRWLLLAVTLWVRIIRDNALVARWLGRHPRMDRRVLGFLARLAWWVLPLAAGAVFLGLFAFANPVIGQFFSNVWTYLDTFFVWVLNLSFMRLGLWIVIMVLLYGLMRHRHSWGSRVQVPPVVRAASMEWLTGPQMIIRLLLVMNVVFLVENVLDAAYLYGGVPLPTGLTYKEYSHRGAYTLIATALLAGIFTLVSFRSNGTAHRSRACRWLVYGWILQNVLLLISTIVRVWVYVDTTELTRLRTATMIWCGIVAAGFLWIILRIKHAKTNAWLWRMNAFTALGVLFVCAFINFDGLIADFNIRHCEQSGGNGYKLDIDYVRHLGPQALPAVTWMRANPGTMEPWQRARMDEISTELRGQLVGDLRNWRGWTLRRRRDAPADVRVEVARGWQAMGSPLNGVMDMQKQRAVTSAEWLEIFQRNAGERNFGMEEGRATEAQVEAVRSSIQEFQLGETGEGMHIMRQAKAFAAVTGDVHYPAALRLFIAEEIRHARELKSFMDGVGIPVVKHTWVDGVFRQVRHLAGLELSIVVLVTAEIIATVYYAALAGATGSTILRRLCEQILRDEAEHVWFQCQRLAIVRQALPRWALGWRRVTYAAFFRMTLLVVWQRHGRALRAGGYGFGRYWKACTDALAEAFLVMSPQHYAWPERKSGRWVKERVRSVGFALQGLWHLVRTEPNARLHLLASAVVVGLGLRLRVGTQEWCWLIAAMGMVWAAEAMNTALELLADAVMPERHPLVGRAKDVAAGAVLLAAGAAAGIGVCVLGPRLGW